MSKKNRKYGRQDWVDYAQKQNYDSIRQERRNYISPISFKYVDYLEKEVENNRMTKKEGSFWKKVNKGLINFDKEVHQYCYKFCQKRNFRLV